MCSNVEAVNQDLKAVGALPQDDVDQRSAARAPISTECRPKMAEEEIPPKKRKTRRGRNKRRHPYLNADRKSTKVIKPPEAPHNSNQFLIEDQGNTKEIDERLRNEKGIARTRDSSFSMDSDGEFYSSPDDEEAFLQKDFDDTYENLRAERLNMMSKAELIEEFLQLEKRVDFLTKRVKGKSTDIDTDEDEKDSSVEFQKEIERLLIENETLKRENSDLRNKMSVSNSDSEDSESDSSETCSSCTSSGSGSVKDVNSLSSPEEAAVDYTQTNGHSPTNLQPV